MKFGMPKFSSGGIIRRDEIPTLPADPPEFIVKDDSQLHIIFRDIVRVVRCKDCKHRLSSEFCECRPDDFFCAEGERKTDETENR